MSGLERFWAVSQVGFDLGLSRLEVRLGHSFRKHIVSLDAPPVPIFHAVA